MKLSVRIALAVLCAALLAVMPFVLSSPCLLTEPMYEIMDALESEEDARVLPSLFMARACAEDEAEAAEETEDVIDTVSEYSLPVDFSVPPKGNPELFTEEGYEDDSIRVQLETREEKNRTWRIAWVEIASPTQLRTAVVGKPTATKGTAKVLAMANGNNAIVAINGDYYRDDPNKTTFEYRMGTKIRDKSNKAKDMLIIDENGDFHTFVHDGKNKSAALTFVKDTGHTIINAFTFGPALVHEGEELKMDKNYGYNPNGREPRSALGQLDTLSYVLVVCEGRNDSSGVTHQELADFMYSLGCKEAFNLDGGGSAALTYNGKYYNKLAGSERAVSDIIYFATAVPEDSWN